MYFKNVKRIIAFGDSNTYGHGMPDADNVGLNSPSNMTWLNLLAEHYGVECVNKGIPGSGNDSMVRLFHEYITGNIDTDDEYNSTARFLETYKPGDAVIFGFSGLYRKELFDQELNQYVRILPSNSCYDNKLKDSILYIALKQPLEKVYRKLYYKIFDIMTICKYYNIPYLFFWAINIEVEINTPSTASKMLYINSITNLCKANWVVNSLHNTISTYFGEKALTPCSHPNELGHKFWADLLVKHIELIKE